MRNHRWGACQKPDRRPEYVQWHVKINGQHTRSNCFEGVLKDVWLCELPLMKYSIEHPLTCQSGKEGVKANVDETPTFSWQNMWTASDITLCTVHGWNSMSGREGLLCWRQLRNSFLSSATTCHNYSSSSQTLPSWSTVQQPSLNLEASNFEGKRDFWEGYQPHPYSKLFQVFSLESFKVTFKFMSFLAQ